eukprot:4475760-Prymnesium_polylepis.1
MRPSSDLRSTSRPLRASAVTVVPFSAILPAFIWQSELGLAAGAPKSDISLASGCSCGTEARAVGGERADHAETRRRRPDAGC